MITKFLKAAVLFSVTALSVVAKANELNAINFNVLPGDRVALRLSMSATPEVPRVFTTENPARIALDFANTTVSLDDKTIPVAIGATRSISAVEAQGRTRVVISLVESVKYTTAVDGNDFIVTIGGDGSAAASTTTAATTTGNMSGTSAMVPKPVAAQGKAITGIDFRRGEQGEGRVVVTLANPNIGIDLRQEGRDVVADFVDADIANELIRKLDVMDFATPAKIVETKQVGANTRLTIKTINEFEFLAYQADTEYTIELKPLTPEEVERRRLQEPQYTGERMSLTFQDITIRAVLQLIADIANVNMVTSDTVSGSITLQLQNVPWDQALDIILKTKGLDKRQNGNVLLIAPADEIAAREALELQSEQQVEQLAPLRSEFVQVNYAKAKVLSEIIQGDKTSFLSDRGSVTVDDRTNTLMLRDTAKKLDEIRQLIRTLDIPVRQVMIESRIVVAEDGVGSEIGVRFGVTDSSDNLLNPSTGDSTTISGTNNASNFFAGLSSEDTLPLNESYNVNLPVSEPAGTIGLTFARLSDGIILDAELSALESENKSEVIASPKVVTANQKEAYIEAGEEIPYQESAGGASGATKIQFKKAVLSLRVTPQITPDDRIILDLLVNQDTRGEETLSGPAINTREVGTQVLVDNGETVVLGGIYQQRNNKDVSKVPLLGDIPGLGILFRRTVESEAKSELLIFVTPKIIKEGVR
ncbi:type IV pilus secretin PilQ [Pleionea litopenaei]|uniref:Type IV pilus secretin PilQ n=1 Tax=Pleionea litopenaei TaxID=3070815 RepID=A0AA51X648_9GAMM|nr:type IV pilus secretin PilQ [Pleionea sp. HL-JVS1]WMS86456.1 type IV pilus secretin PilQ [Pleionea sp. HL-JVS1]